jgi:hypothetical protein
MPLFHQVVDRCIDRQVALGQRLQLIDINVLQLVIELNLPLKLVRPVLERQVFSEVGLRLFLSPFHLVYHVLVTLADLSDFHNVLRMVGLDVHKATDVVLMLLSLTLELNLHLLDLKVQLAVILPELRRLRGQLFVKK